MTDVFWSEFWEHVPATIIAFGTFLAAVGSLLGIIVSNCMTIRASRKLKNEMAITNVATNARHVENLESLTQLKNMSKDARDVNKAALEELTVVADEIRIRGNSATDKQLRLAAIALKRLALATGLPEHAEEARIAQQLYEDHLEQQKIINGKKSDGTNALQGKSGD